MFLVKRISSRLDKSYAYVHSFNFEPHYAHADYVGKRYIDIIIYYHSMYNLNYLF